MDGYIKILATQPILYETSTVDQVCITKESSKLLPQLSPSFQRCYTARDLSPYLNALKSIL